MSSRDLQFTAPVTTTGAAPARRRRIGERDAKARRFLFEVAELTYDPDLDVNWDADLDDDLVWLPEDRLSLYGTNIWDALSEERRTTLAKREFVALISASIYWRSLQSIVYFRDVIEKTNLANDYARFTLTSINDESRNATMLSRVVNMTGLAPYRLPRGLRILIKFVPMLPSGPAGEGARLLVHEMTVSIFEQLAADTRIHPHVRQVALHHVIASRRHLEIAREELLNSVNARGKIRNSVHRWLLAVATTHLYRLAVDRRIYREVGLDPQATARIAYSSPTYLANLRETTQTFRAFAYEEGIFHGPLTHRILQKHGLGDPAH